MRRLIFSLTLVSGLILSPLLMFNEAAGQQSTPQSEASPTLTNSGSGTIRILLRGCDDGIDPQQSPADCDVPLDAPMRAGIFDTATNEYIANIDEDTHRESDGTYVIENVPEGVELHLIDFMPTVHNFFMYEGADDVNDADWSGMVTLDPGEVRDITIYYWNGEEGLIEPGTSEVSVLLRGCPEGVDPNTDASECTIPLDAPDASTVGLTSGTGRAIPLADHERREDGAYLITLQAYDRLIVSGLPGVNNDSLVVTNADSADNEEGAFVVKVTRNEPREVIIYYYNALD